MMITIDNFLTEPEIAELLRVLETAQFVDGKDTAGASASQVKHNLQARSGQKEIDRWENIIIARARTNAVFEIAARPKWLNGARVLFSSYTEGNYYGSHVDNALLPNGARRDLAFTLFISEPTNYQGGELIIEQPAVEARIKLAAGSMIVYPANTLHQVAKVRKGHRLAAVGWVQSYIREPSKRELLFDLTEARSAIFQKDGKTKEFDLLTKTEHNLLRMWSE